MAEMLTPEHFLPHLQKVFRVENDRHVLTLTHVEVSDATGAPRPLFNLIFAGPPGDLLPEGFYTLEVDGGPQFGLYLMPIHTPAPGLQNYQAAFN